MREFIYGRNPVYETLRAKRRDAFRLEVAEGVQDKGRLTEILDLAAKRKIPIERVPRTRLDKLSDSHQGVALEVSCYPYVTLDDILENALAFARCGLPRLRPVTLMPVPRHKSYSRRSLTFPQSRDVLAT